MNQLSQLVPTHVSPLHSFFLQLHNTHTHTDKSNPNAQTTSRWSSEGGRSPNLATRTSWRMKKKAHVELTLHSPPHVHPTCCSKPPHSSRPTSRLSWTKHDINLANPRRAGCFYNFHLKSFKKNCLITLPDIKGCKWWLFTFRDVSTN